MKIFITLLFLTFLSYPFVSQAQFAHDWISYNNRQFGKIRFDLYAKRGSWGGQQFYGANCYNGTSYKIRIEGEIYAQLICGNEVSSRFSFTADAYGEKYKIDPASKNNGHNMDNTGLISSALDDQCKGNEINVKHMWGDEEKWGKTRTRISALGVRGLKLTAIYSDGTELPIDFNGNIIETEEDKRRKEEQIQRERNAEDTKRLQDQQRQNEVLKKADEQRQNQQRINEERAAQQEQARQQEVERQRKAEAEAKRQEAINLQNRIDSYKNSQNQFEQSQKQMAESLSTIITSSSGGTAYDKLGFGMNFGGGLCGLGIPLVQNSLSTKNTIIPYSSSTQPINLGLYANAELWLLKNQYFGIGGDGNFVYGAGIFGGSTSSAQSYGYNFKANAGLSWLKLHAEIGKDYRNGSYTEDADVSAASLGISGNSGIVSSGTFDYSVNRKGAGVIIEFSDDEEETFVSYTLIMDSPDFLPSSYQPLKMHKLVVRVYIDFIVCYSNNYAIAGTPKYAFNSTDKNQSYLFVGLGKTFKVFKVNYSKR